MPHHKSAKKRLRNSRKQRLRNRASRAVMRSSIRSFRKAVASSEEMDQQQGLSSMYQLLDVQARKGLIHKRKAARLKSRLSNLIQK